MESVMQEHGTSAGQITREFFETTLTEFAVRLNRSQMQQNPPPQTTPTATLHSWAGRLSKLPQDFEFPAADAATAWRLWWLGNVSKGYPPFRFIVPLDLATQKQRKLLSEWKFAMGRFERACIAGGVSIVERPTEEIVSQSFDCIAQYLRHLFGRVPSKRPRRLSQLHLISIVRTLRAVRD
ncbi:Aste57867_24080 [Aphanomyces stellatus]|nr:hypothetical protein As57867_024007 [Aphanomyces stellatus]KAF0712119.1 hypothetical protein As57867_004902 [Aphanomyces stellatus]VFT82006.1 Aste57867_4915 [Aphanomyces stellatus]VFU00722.1 Aste57867_24080 [Aphanomyces stellatus]